MKYPDRKHTRPGTTRRVRLDGYDYSAPGYYFVTICTHKRHQYFGRIENECFQASPAGNMANFTIRECAERFSSVSIDAHVVMPNHVHLLVGLAVRLDDIPNTDNLVDVIHWFKATVYQRFRAGVRTNGWPPYDGTVWQEGFHDHIIRSERELETIRNYVSTNIQMWEKDTFYDGFQDW